MTDEAYATPFPADKAREAAMTMATRKRRVQTNGDLVIETRIPKWTRFAKGS